MGAGDPLLDETQGGYGEKGFRIDGLLKFSTLFEWFATVGGTSRLRLKVRKST